MQRSVVCSRYRSSSRSTVFRNPSICIGLSGTAHSKATTSCLFCSISSSLPSASAQPGRKWAGWVWFHWHSTSAMCFPIALFDSPAGVSTCLLIGSYIFTLPSAWSNCLAGYPCSSMRMLKRYFLLMKLLNPKRFASTNFAIPISSFFLLSSFLA